MLELTLIMLVAAMIFYVLHLLFKKDELDAMSIIMCTIAMAVTLKDTEIGDDLLFFVIPLFYGILTSALSLIPWGKKE